MREVYARGSEDEREHIQWRWKESACYSFPPRWELAANAAGMTTQAYRLLFGLISAMGWHNRVEWSVGMIARRLKMAPATVPRALQRLERAQLIHIDRSNTRGLVITVSPYLVWQGRPPGVYALRKVWAEMCAGTLTAPAAVVPETDADATPTAPTADSIRPSHPGGDPVAGADPSLHSLLEEGVGLLRQ